MGQALIYCGLKVCSRRVRAHLYQYYSGLNQLSIAFQLFQKVNVLSYFFIEKFIPSFQVSNHWLMIVVKKNRATTFLAWISF